jgi:hypothetical protein
MSLEIGTGKNVAGFYYYRLAKWFVFFIETQVDITQVVQTIISLALHTGSRGVLRTHSKLLLID